MYPPDFSPRDAASAIKADIYLHLIGCFTDSKNEHPTINELCKLVDMHIKKINTNSNPYL